MIDPVIIKRITGSTDWAVFKAHIEDTIDTLDRTSDIDTHDDRACAIEVAGRKRAAIILRKILAPFEIEVRGADVEENRRSTMSDAGLQP